MTIAANATIQVGSSATSSNNLTLDVTANNGTAAIYLGNAGASVTNVANVASSGQVSFKQPPVSQTPQSMVQLNTANGYGSTNTGVRRFTTVQITQGTDITWADSATLGGSATINTGGVYGVSYSDQFSAGSTLFITLNSTAGITATNTLIVASSGAANAAASASWIGYLPAGSVIRAQSAGLSSGTVVAACQFTITRIA